MAFTIAQLQAFSNTKPELRYVTEEIIDYLEANPGGGGITDITFANLLTAIAESTLTPGGHYLITDFATKHYIVDSAGAKPTGNPIITGTTEPLIVTAIATNKVDKQAMSTVYPQDIIYIDFTESNWTDDFSFEISGVIIPGWKGTIYFRHDTLLDNYMGYDFRNCKFRRWKTNAVAWSGATTYAADNYVSFNGFLYWSLRGTNLNHSPDTSEDFWIKLLDLTLTEHWIAKAISNNGITASSEFDDFKTFAESAGSGTYELCCTGNHFSSFKDVEVNFNTNGSILLNNVFFLKDANYFYVYNNSFGVEFCNNTFAADVFENTWGNDCVWNMISGRFAVSSIANNFLSSILGSTQAVSFMNECNNNKIGYDFGKTSVQNSVRDNKIGNSCQNNTIGNSFINHTIKNSFQMNNIQDGLGAAIDFTAATHVYAVYNCTIFKRVGGGQRLSYVDASDVVTIVAANA